MKCASLKANRHQHPLTHAILDYKERHMFAIYIKSPQTHLRVSWRRQFKRKRHPTYFQDTVQYFYPYFPLQYSPNVSWDPACPRDASLAGPLSRLPLPLHSCCILW